MDKPTILNAATLPATTTAELEELFDVLTLPAAQEEVAPFLKAHGARVRAIALRKVKIDEDFLAALPALELISSYSAGLDNVDIAATKARNIPIENTSHILANDVANAAIALALAVTRDIVNADGFVRSGTWLKQKDYPLGRSISAMNVGIVGLGAIGSAIATRLLALGARVGYCGPHKKPVPHEYFQSPTELATWADMLIVTCPLSPATHHLVNAEVLTALGSQGYLVNISRGPVVDEEALLETLAADGLAGAALDVFEHEPQVPEALIKDTRLVLTPHLGSGTIETRQAMADNVVDTLARHFNIKGPRG